MSSIRVRVGTASWTDPTLVRESDWYPKRSMSAEQRLRYYADRFRVVEVDATYYYPPTRDLAARWVERTPDEFVFDVKAFGLFTHHPVKAGALWEDVVDGIRDEHRDKDRHYLSHLDDAAVDLAWERFGDALLPLDSAGKLGAVFLQFPPWFTNNRGNRAYLDEVAERLPGYRLAVEFRHASWFDGESQPRTLAQLERLGLAYTVVDEPQGSATSIPPILARTSDLAVVRFHGHNRENWQKKGITAAERFRYLYSEDELAEWAPRIRDLAEGSQETHVLMNNCYRDYGVRNAAQLATMLS